MDNKFVKNVKHHIPTANRVCFCVGEWFGIFAILF